MVEVAIGGGGQLQGAEADVVQRLVVDAEVLVGVLDQLVDGEGGVVRLHDGVGHLGTGHDAKMKSAGLHIEESFRFHPSSVTLLDIIHYIGDLLPSHLVQADEYPLKMQLL